MKTPTVVQIYNFVSTRFQLPQDEIVALLMDEFEWPDRVSVANLKDVVKTTVEALEDAAQ